MNGYILSERERAERNANATRHANAIANAERERAEREKPRYLRDYRAW